MSFWSPSRAILVASNGILSALPISLYIISCTRLWGTQLQPDAPLSQSIEQYQSWISAQMARVN
ncbi:MAG: hypothetical protein WB820_03540, partial [Rhodoplanes sp.]